MGDLLMNRLLPLMAIISVALFLVLLGSALIFTVIVPLPNFLPGRSGSLITGIVKGGLSTILVLVWIYVLMMITEFYMRQKMK